MSTWEGTGTAARAKPRLDFEKGFVLLRKTGKVFILNSSGPEESILAGAGNYSVCSLRTKNGINGFRVLVCRGRIQCRPLMGFGVCPGSVLRFRLRCPPGAFFQEES
jgi:hypothetical protein